MKIGIEAQRIFRKNKHGMDIVALELIRNLQQHDLINEYIVFVKDDLDDQVIQESPNLKIVRLKGGPYPYWEQVLLSRAASTHEIDLLHCTSNTAPLRLTVPLVLTVHDIIYLEKWNFTKGTSYQIIGNLYRRWNVPQVVAQAAKIITVSHFEEKRIREHFNLPPNRIQAVYNGVGTHFQKITDTVRLASARRRYNLPDKFIFFLGNTDPKKNVEGVIKALSLIKAKGRLSFKLVMLDIDRAYLERIASNTGNVSILDEICFTGYVPNEELPAIYSLASLFIYPSLRESFGIPILEAMACETPVLTSETSSMPEVAGGAALLVDPFNPEAIANGILKILEDDQNRFQMIAMGIKRAKNFSWQNNADQTLRIYNNVLEETRPGKKSAATE
jgi:glycosyltransferase involved in cell wall biosynthesis